MFQVCNKYFYLKVILILFILFVLLSISCSVAGPDKLEPVTVLLDWTPNTNFSGIYAAIEQGYYREEGLTVELIEAPGSVIQMIGTDKASFGFSFQEEVTFARLAGIPIVSLAAVIQHNSSGFISLKERGINSPADFEGKRYGGWGSPVEEATIRALMELYNADFSQVEMITTGEVDQLIVIEREADFAWIFYGWTGIEAEIKGMDISFITLREENPALDYYTPVIISNEKLIQTNPNLAERFMRATARGYQFTIKNPEEAARILLKAVPELNPELVKASQKWLADRYQAEADSWGIQDLAIWENYGRWLFNNGLIEEIPEWDKAFTNAFLP